MFIYEFDNICDIWISPKEDPQKCAFGKCNFCNNNLSFREAIRVDQSDIAVILPRLLKSVVDNIRGPKIDYNVAVKKQRKLITDYVNNFRQGKCCKR